MNPSPAFRVIVASGKVQNLDQTAKFRELVQQGSLNLGRDDKKADPMG
jgi:hypothetical protein